MKILFLTPWYPDDRSPNHGIFVRNLATAMAGIHEVHVIAAKIDYSEFGLRSYRISHSEFGQVKEHRLIIRRSLPVYNQLNFFLIAIGVTRKLIKDFTPDIIHGNIGYPGGYWTWRVAKRLGKPFILTEHTRITNNFRTPVHKWLTLLALRKCDAIQTVSSRMAREIEEWTGKKPVVIPNIIAELRKPETTPKSDGVVQIGFLGNLNTPVKGLDILLWAISKITTPYKLHIAGAGLLLDQHKALAKELGIAGKCVFHGFVPHWSVPAIFGQVNFVVSASRYESFGMIVLEAIGTGLPVVATRCGGPEDFVTKDSGILVAAEDIGAMTEGIAWMMDHYKTFDAEGMRKYVQQNFSAAVVARKMNEVYLTLTADRS